jgi:hypothetical protein
LEELVIPEEKHADPEHPFVMATLEKAEHAPLADKLVQRA